MQTALNRHGKHSRAVAKGPQSRKGLLHRGSVLEIRVPGTGRPAPKDTDLITLRVTNKGNTFPVLNLQ